MSDSIASNPTESVFKIRTLYAAACGKPLDATDFIRAISLLI
jgi:hypothetical protein